MSRFPWAALAVATLAAVLIPQPVSYARTRGLIIQVDAGNPSASDATLRNATSPFKSISGALRAAAQLGGTTAPITILVHPGIYRETVIVQQPVILLGQAGGRNSRQRSVADGVDPRRQLLDAPGGADISESWRMRKHPVPGSRARLLRRQALSPCRGDSHNRPICDHP